MTIEVIYEGENTGLCRKYYRNAINHSNNPGAGGQTRANIIYRGEKK